MPVMPTDQTPTTRLTRVRAFIQSPLGGLILLLLALLGAAVALREHSVKMDFAMHTGSSGTRLPAGSCTVWAS